MWNRMASCCAPRILNRSGLIPAALSVSNLREMSSRAVGGDGAVPMRPWPKVVLYGASITQHSFSREGQWGAILADRLQRRCDVVVRGFSGYNTRLCRKMLPAILPTFGEPVAALTVLLGTNDSCPADVSPLQHVPLEEYGENLKWMVNYLQSQGIEANKVILISPPMFDGGDSRDEEPLRGQNAILKKYANACGAVAEGVGCGFVDMFSIMRTKYPQGRWKKLLSDGVHFSAEGSQVLADQLWPLIEKRIQHVPFVEALDECF